VKEVSVKEGRQQSDHRDALHDKAGKYLTFVLGNEDFGLEILKVREIIALMDITPVPMAPGYVRGVINLRGKIIPVVDLRLKFSMDRTPDHDRKCIIVVDVKRGAQSVQMSILVDAVSEVIQIDGKDIGPPPAFGSTDATFILGMGKYRGRLKLLLDIDNVLGSSSTLSLGHSTQDSGAGRERILGLEQSEIGTP
jgi:purine-binding chemotaxis protein CheW